MELLEVKGLGKDIKDGLAVQELSFVQQEGEQMAIIGETGSGKSSLLKMIAGLLQPDKGEIFYKGKRVRGPLEKLLPGHPEIAFLSQHFELRNNYRVEEELEAKNLLATEEAAALYERCRISTLLSRRTDQLSGGERQRVVLARLLSTQPGLLLLDEPFSNLDQSHTRLMKKVIQDIVEMASVTVMMVSHDAEDLLSWAHRVLVLRKGSLVQQGTPHLVYEYPADIYTASLLGEFNLLPAPVFYQLTGTSRDAGEGNSWFARTEKFYLGNPDETGLICTVKNSRYRGSYFMNELVSGSFQLLVRTNSQLEKGSAVKVSIAPADIHAIKNQQS